MHFWCAAPALCLQYFTKYYKLFEFILLFFYLRACYGSINLLCFVLVLYVFAQYLLLIYE